MNTFFATFYQLELVMKNNKTGWQSRLIKCSPKAGQSDRIYFVAVPMSIANYGSLGTLRASAATLTCEICGLTQSSSILIAVFHFFVARSNAEIT